jgi:preprotein translocase subunit YajC
VKKILSLFLLSQVFVSQVLAQAPVAAPAQPSFGDVLGRMAPMFLVVFLVFHFLIIKPQRKKEQEHAALLDGLKVGDSVITSSGMVGKVTTAGKDFVTLEVSSGVKIKFLASHILKKESA